MITLDLSSACHILRDWRFLCEKTYRWSRCLTPLIIREMQIKTTMSSHLTLVRVLVTQSCPTLWYPMDYSPPDSTVYENVQGKNTGVDCHSFLQGIFPTEGLNPGLPYCRQILYFKPAEKPTDHNGPMFNLCFSHWSWWLPLKKKKIHKQQILERMWRKGNPLALFGGRGNVNWYSPCAEKYGCSLKNKTKNRAIIWSSKSTPGHIFRGNDNSKRCMHLYIHSCCC